MCRKDRPDAPAELEKGDFTGLPVRGCGTVPMLSLLQKQYPEKHCSGIDRTPEMIEAARAKHMPGVGLVVGNCGKLPFADRSFDVVICCQSFRRYPNVRDFFDSAPRMLRPGGRPTLRDMTAKTAIVRWIIIHIELSLVTRRGMATFADTAQRKCGSFADGPVG